LIERSAKHYGFSPGEIYLSGGDPNFATPAHIRDAAIKAIIEGYTHYAPSEGIPECREAIANYYSKFGVEYDPSQIFITSGGGAALYHAMAGFLKSGDEVLTFDPSYAANFSYPEALGAKVVPVPLTEPGYHLDPEELKERVSERSKLFVMTNPCNPTGTVFTREELRALADIAIDNDLLVVSDEFYLEYVYDGREHVAVSSLDGMKDRTIVVLGGTKIFAFTGWRLASMIIPKDLYSQVMDKIVFRIGPATFVQKAAAVGFNALTKPLGAGVMAEWREEFDRRRRFFCNRMDDIKGVSCHTFEGAFYAYPDVSSFGVPVERIVRELLEKEKVRVASGERFGGVRILGEKSPAFGHIRPCLVQDLDDLGEAADRIERYLKTL
jgi:aspartate/methionine/tyrosine aminotransferase